MKKPAMSWQSRQLSTRHTLAMAAVVLVFGGIGYVGFRLYAAPVDGNNPGIPGRFDPRTGQSDDATLGVPTAPEIDNAGDLNDAQAALEAIDPKADNQPDASQLDMQLNGL